ncbi:3-oxoacyl-[acyl-carrier protein] reductase [Pullulanibacillus pueri]|uniref:3-ketoacyl-ACP reductase n=1 Tax=Pullulanibacillus pueri TaxID=1437324 RepID=A0A8J3EN40_9BACL|nr:SDR family oxidoreductase [Pullulanibacillus pueri]MBM7682795.1 3-oxoacyl-[acyl-carrier protein] reductase [Pullulanibacillus pueri]GGH83214.1 3-ketoacyl-ACP reductase [Pullulanibacillus pueri]
MNIDGATIVITGASKGIGKETAALLRKENVNLVLGSRSGQKNELDQLLELPLDVANEDSVIQFYTRAVQKFGSIDVLINCAGTGSFEHIIESSTQAFDEMLSVNLRGTYLMCKHFGKHMAGGGKGHILNLISIAGTTALPGGGGYSASKFGVLGLTRVLQTELRQKGVQVTAVLPGAVRSSFWDQIEPKPDLSQMIPTETLAQHLVNIIHQPPGAYVDEVTLMPPLGIL